VKPVTAIGPTVKGAIMALKRFAGAVPPHGAIAFCVIHDSICVPPQLLLTRPIGGASAPSSSTRLRAKKKQTDEKYPNSAPLLADTFDATAHGCSSVARSTRGVFDDVFCPTVSRRMDGYLFAA
jgi:hypothetical protein